MIVMNVPRERPTFYHNYTVTLITQHINPSTAGLYSICTKSVERALHPLPAIIKASSSAYGLLCGQNKTQVTCAARKTPQLSVQETLRRGGEPRGRGQVEQLCTVSERASELAAGIGPLQLVGLL